MTTTQTQTLYWLRIYTLATQVMYKYKFQTEAFHNYSPPLMSLVPETKALRLYHLVLKTSLTPPPPLY